MYCRVTRVWVSAVRLHTGRRVFPIPHNVQVPGVLMGKISRPHNVQVPGVLMGKISRAKKLYHLSYTGRCTKLRSCCIWNEDIVQLGISMVWYIVRCVAALLHYATQTQALHTPTNLLRRFELVKKSETVSRRTCLSRLPLKPKSQHQGLSFCPSVCCCAIYCAAGVIFTASR